ncbi:response regulator [Halomonas sp. BM-2019]|uniref:response regulator n=1 Tax=Halomonas sp. BM-2019 TaxID=2811227 RepID=UPI0031FC7671
MVTIADSGAAALKRVAARRFDLIFMDVQMPDMDGLEVTRRLRARKGWAAGVPIVAMTAGGPGGEQARCLAAGMNGYLTKPLRQEALLDVLHRHLLENQALPPLTAAAGQGALVDPLTLQALHEQLGAGGLQSLMALYRDQVEVRLAGLERALGEGADLEAARHAAHQLKGESASLGAVKVAGHALRLERLAGKGDRVAARAMLHELMLCVTATLAALEIWLEAPQRSRRST